MEKSALVLLALIGIGILGVGMLFAAMPASSERQIETKQIENPQGPVQTVEITATARGYEPKEVRVKAGMPVDLRFKASPDAGCSRMLIIREFGVQLLSTRSGEIQTALFTPPPGEYKYRCSMNMFRGKLIAE